MSDFNLPEGWDSSKLEDLVFQSFTGLVRSATEQGADNSHFYLKMNNISSSGAFDLSDLVKINANEAEVARYSLKKGDFIFNTRNSVELVGKCGVFNVDSSTPILFNNNLLKINFFHIRPEIIAHWLNSAIGKNQLKSITSATTSVAAIYQKQLMALDVPVIPLAEQQQIAQKLDELLAQVDTLKTRLGAIPKILKRFRQSVLAAAVSGRLTEEWRNFLPYKAAKNKMDFFVGIDVGYAFKSAQFSDAGVKLLRGQNIEPGSLRWFETKCYPEGQIAGLEHLYLKEADIILAMDRPIVSAGLKLARVKKSDLPCILVQRVARFKDFEGITPDYLYLLLSSFDFLNYIQPNQTGSDIPHISGKQILDYEILVPALSEQTEIVRRVEQLFAYADQIEQRVKDAQARVNHLTQSILAKAFRGELTADWRAQNPELISGENSAAALLERIKAEREVAVKPKRKGKQ